MAQQDRRRLAPGPCVDEPVGEPQRLPAAERARRQAVQTEPVLPVPEVSEASDEDVDSYFGELH